MEISNNIALVVENSLGHPDVKKWFHSVRKFGPNGIMTTVQVDDKSAELVKVRRDGAYQYVIPLVRDLTQTEVEKIVENFSLECDFEIITTHAPEYQIDTTVKVDHDPLMDLCSAWAKDKHQAWKTEKEESGWRFGLTMCRKAKTHPLLRDWSDIPSEYKKVDTKQVSELLELLKNSGYVLIHTQDLDYLLGHG